MTSLNLFECCDVLLALPKHRMTIRERGEHDGYHGLERASLPKATLQLDYDRGYSYGQGCARRLIQVRLEKGRTIAMADAAPTAFREKHPRGLHGVQADRFVS